MPAEGPSWSTLLGMGVVIAAQLVAGLALGWVVDHFSGTTPIFLLVGLLLGIAGAITYTAPASGTDTLTYTVKDQHGNVATSSYAITVDNGPKAAAGTGMAPHGWTLAIGGYGLTTADIHYHMPDHPKLLQQFIWQEYDLAPLFPRLFI